MARVQEIRDLGVAESMRLNTCLIVCQRRAKPISHMATEYLEHQGKPKLPGRCTDYIRNALTATPNDKVVWLVSSIENEGKISLSEYSALGIRVIGRYNQCGESYYGASCCNYALKIDIA